jgi:Flp pilus assembly pilin Flp
MKGGSHHTIVRGIAVENGQAAVEYAAILGLVTALLIAAYGLLGGTVLDLYQQVVTAFS